MRKFALFFVLVLSFVLPIAGQNNDYDFCSRSKKLETSGMYILGGWAAANIAYGAYGWANYKGQMKYFSQMNLFWNTVNLAIASFSLYNNYNVDCNTLSIGEALAKQMKIERILLINAGLDAVYIGTGTLLRILSAKSEKRQDLLMGYGYSLILQGAFLLVFDLSLYGVLVHNRPEIIHNVGFTVSPQMSGFYLALKF